MNDIFILLKGEDFIEKTTTELKYKLLFETEHLIFGGKDLPLYKVIVSDNPEHGVQRINLTSTPEPVFEFKITKDNGTPNENI